MNVNWNADNREWNVNAWKLDDNNWNAGNRVFVRNFLFLPLLRRRGSFRCEALAPAAYHPSDFFHQFP